LVTLGQNRPGIYERQRTNWRIANDGNRSCSLPVETDFCHPRSRIGSEIQVLFPHAHSNAWKVRPEDGLSMLLRNLGCSPHFMQRGETGFTRSCFSMRRRQCL
jgi:hypothetical protein